MRFTCALVFLLTLSLHTFAQVPNSFVNGEPANANQINENFNFLNGRMDTADAEITGMKTYLGMDGSNNIQVSGNASASAFFYTSDASLKNGVQTLENSLHKIKQMRGVTFYWKDNSKQQMGLIAQEVEQVYPQLVEENAQAIKTVQYGNLVAPLIESIKELADQNEALRRQIRMQQKQLEEIMNLQAQQASLLQQLKNNHQKASVAQNRVDLTGSVQTELTHLTSKSF